MEVKEEGWLFKINSVECILPSLFPGNRNLYLPNYLPKVLFRPSGCIINLKYSCIACVSAEQNLSNFYLLEIRPAAALIQQAQLFSPIAQHCLKAETFNHNTKTDTSTASNIQIKSRLVFANKSRP